MAATARSRCRPKGRTCHLIDIENLCGGTAGVDEAAVTTAVARYKRTITVADDDLVVIGSGPTLAPVAKAAWPSARLVVAGASTAPTGPCSPRMSPASWPTASTGWWSAAATMRSPSWSSTCAPGARPCAS